jgi:crotonobetainyl-CoA:carnitine CoA-transferase CaiB-like acyl-CoA transferase
MGLPAVKHDRTKPSNPMWNTYRTKDDRWIWLSMQPLDIHWANLCRAIERPELENDPRFNTDDGREQNSGELIRILDAVLVTKTMEEWERGFRENDCIYGRIQTTDEVTRDPQALVNDFFAGIHHPVAREIKLVATPVKFRQNPALVRAPAPEIGQHTEEILLELGYNRDAIIQLKEQGIIL